MRRIYEPLTGGSYYAQADALPGLCNASHPAKLLVTSAQSAEIIKHASNAFLAIKISFINAVANLAEAVDADIEEIATGIGLDSRIGPSSSAPGWATAVPVSRRTWPPSIWLRKSTASSSNCFRMYAKSTKRRRLFLQQGAVGVVDATWQASGGIGTCFQGRHRRCPLVPSNRHHKEPLGSRRHRGYLRPRPLSSAPRKYCRLRKDSAIPREYTRRQRTRTQY